MEENGITSINVLVFIFIFGAYMEVTESMGFCKFARTFPCVDKEKCSNVSRIFADRTLEAKIHERNTVQPTPGENIPTDVSTNRPSAIHSSQYSISDPRTINPLCPSNMLYANCSTCQGTCDDPTNCYSNCTEQKTCVCPDGFLMKGNDCVAREMCECFVEGHGVIQQESSYVTSDCSERCNCSEGTLTCNKEFECASNAICEVRDNVGNCHCEDEFAGNGQICVNISTLTDCYDIFKSGVTSNGIYKIKPTGWNGAPFEVYCNMSHGGGWTVLQRRVNGSVNFYRGWNSYKKGFGLLNHEFWIGNDQISYLTNQKNYRLRIDLVYKDGEPHNMNYDFFRVGNEASLYQLKLGDYTGNTGYDYMAYHKDRPFSTSDTDNDARSGSCAVICRGAWWYGFCYDCNLNGDYKLSGDPGISLYNHGKSGFDQRDLQYTQMKVKPV